LRHCSTYNQLVEKAVDSLLRGVDNAFAECSAAVFFLSGQFVDNGVIRREVDRAIHKKKEPEGSCDECQLLTCMIRPTGVWYGGTTGTATFAFSENVFA
jgi:hypothetical protein